MLDKAKVRQIAQEYTDEVCRALQPKSVILFGSYVNGTPHEYSDIDIAVVLRIIRATGMIRRFCCSACGAI